ncbi:fumarylacetoacetate hydrolase family protein [Mycobacterium paraterrae]|uniref:Fumarylacetoacetate hydrolase family protein n=1 Tax=Mycobacterium paraterrae TaxID=577492 RepID=A0ABY3VR12_9MYCO|nr:fumarylacetoacetate hydrolase family protein [Mycobacterium paraterrae]UMB69602.1 fumarylacetoacetate hydrolase family protein [Mycobacterium paraterrae]
MRLATVQRSGAERVIADADDGQRFIDVGAALGDDTVTMTTLIGLEQTARGDVARRVRGAAPQCRVADREPVVWLPPVPQPSKIVGVALNNDVFNHLAVHAMSAPMYFLAPSTSMVGHGGAIELRTGWGVVHPEPELAAVIGARVRRASPKEALAAVFGYTIVNDVTSPGIKSQDSVELVMPQGVPVDEPWRIRRGEDDRSLYLTYHARSKGSDTFTPIGPWVTLRDDVGDPNALGVRAYLDGELVLQDSTANLTFPVHEVLAHLSESMTLLPGDIVHFGTAARPAAPERFPTIRSIDLNRYGTRVSVEVDGIGRLDNLIERHD